MWRSSAVVATLVGLYFLFSSAGKVVVQPDGSIDGISNIVRSALQGDRFWTDQLHLAQKSLAWELGGPERKMKIESLMKELDQETNKVLEDQYRRYPQLAPSGSELEAQRLRDRANQIESDALDSELEVFRQKRITRLKAVILFLERKNQ